MADFSASSSSSSRDGQRGKSSLDDQLSSPSINRSPIRSGKNSDLDGMPSRLDENGRPLPAWKLREQMKSQNNVSNHPSRSIRPVSGTAGRGIARIGGTSAHSLSSGSYRKARGDLDPSLPPAFRAAFSKQHYRKQPRGGAAAAGEDGDDFMSLDSVHSCKNSVVTGTPTTANNDSDGSIGSDSFDGHDSFASLGEDSDDDEAYRESKNQLARQEIEGQATQTRGGVGGSSGKRGGDFRFKKVAMGVHGTPLDFIAE